MPTNIEELRNEAKTSRENSDYKKGAELFDKLWREAEPKDKWDGWGLAFCLNRLKKYDEAYKASTEVYKMDKDFDYNNSQLAFASFMANIKNFPDDGDAAELAKYVHEVIEATENRKDDLFRIQSVLKMMEFSADKNYWEKVIEWAKHINVETLSTEEFRGTSSDGKKFIKPSDKESYYLKLSKAHDKLNNYNECLAICNEGLQRFPSQTWLLWHKGVSLSKLGKLDEAIDFLQKAASLKKDWFILRDLSAAFYRKNDYSDALNVFLDAAVNSLRIPKPEFRWELYYLGGKIYEKFNRVELAEKHFTLVFKLRDEQGWKIQDFLEAEVKKYSPDLNISAKDIINQLSNIWQSEKAKQLPLKKGNIKNFIRDGKAGFIKAEDGEDYYFRSDSRVNKTENLQVDDNVTFRIQKSFDKVKKKDSLEAVFISKNS